MSVLTSVPREESYPRLSINRLLGVLLKPSTVDLLFVFLAVFVAFAFTKRLFGSDGDIGRHIRVGEDFLTGRALFFHDHYSYTMLGQSFVPYEWLSEVGFALAHRLGGLAGVAVFTGLVIAATYTLVAVLVRHEGGDATLAIGVGFASALVGLVHWLARPHIFTPLGAILLLFILERPGRRSLALTVPLFVTWVNLHGGFLYGLVLIAAYIAGDLLEAGVSEDRPTWLRRAANHAGVLVVAIVACCLNPTGPRLFAHVTGFLGDRLLVDRTLEYMSPNFHEPFFQIFLVVLLLAFLSLAVNQRRLPFPRLILVFMNVAFALYSVRNIPLFAVTVIPIVAFSADSWWQNRSAPRRLRSIVANGERGSLPGLWAGFASVALILVATQHGLIGDRQVVATSFEADHFPVAAVQRARESGLSGRVFNEIIWGGYILYAWPEQQVFIDGQTDFYGDAITQSYLQITELQAGWREALRQWDVAVVLVPADSLLSRELAREPNWHVWYADQTAVILQRNP